MKIGLVGPSYVERSLPFDCQRTINLYPVVNETKMGKEVTALYGTPGLTNFTTAGAGPIRAVFASTNGRAFCISASELYEISSTGVITARGTLNSSSGTCSMTENPTQLAMCDGTDAYTFIYSSNTFADITDADFPTSAGTITFVDGYFVVNKGSSGAFYISTLNDGTSWASLDFATAESSPDYLVRPFGALGQLWLFGALTTEAWYNNGDVTFPFARIPGAKMETGCAAAHSVVSMDNSIFWIGKDKDGQGIVYRANGFSPQRISTHAIEYAINKIADISTIRAYTYQQDGHAFYVLTAGSLTTSLVYDASTKLWHERATLDDDGAYTTHRATSSMFIFNKHLVGDKTNANIYEVSLSDYDDGGNEIKRQRTFTHINNEGKRFRANELQVDFEYGVGISSGQGSDPIAILEISTDGGRTWSQEYQAKIGKVGNYKARAVWRRLGTADQMTFRVTISEPVKVAICGAYLR